VKLHTWGLVAVIAVGATTQPFSCFPRMKSTPSIKPYQQRLPDTPRGAVPYAQGAAMKPTAPVPKVPATAANVELGGVYYTYYCQMCHGEGARGDGSVGHSYTPPAPALNTARVRAMTDDELIRKMLSGIGHDPVLPSTVPRERRGYLVAYLRHAGGAR
jgi:hypothetical protein